MVGRDAIRLSDVETTWVAVGVLMETGGGDAEQAFDVLRHLAQRGRKPTLEAAQIVIGAAVMGCALTCEDRG